MNPVRILTSFENDISWSFLVDFKTRKNGKNLVYLRPYVCIINNNSERLNAFQKLFKIDLPVYALEVDKWSNKRIVLQKMEDVEALVAFYQEYDWLYSANQETYIYFVKTFNLLSSIGTKHEVWIDEIEEFINNRDVINTNGRSMGKPMINKIKEHLGEVIESRN